MLLLASGLAYHAVEVPARAALSAWVERRLGSELGRGRAGGGAARPGAAGGTGSGGPKGQVVASGDLGARPRAELLRADAAAARPHEAA